MNKEISVTEAFMALKPFINRDDAFAVMKDGLNEYFVVKEFLFPKYLKDHIDGQATIGVFQIAKDNTIKWLCWDFDADSEEPQHLEIVLNEAKRLYEHLKILDYFPLMEFSGRRGYHVWLFLEKTEAELAQSFAKNIAEELALSNVEVFPKQARLDKKGYGSMVKLPLGIHRVSNKRSFLLDDEFNELNLSDSFHVLKNVKINIIKRFENFKNPL
ncbi:MAG: hypothetical protein HY831_04075 [Candidatus Aenigmarchaeota archaeon]|nr:hypothetical protein [Candidatus Aenigmarchaeota archaeon]